MSSSAYHCRPLPWVEPLLEISDKIEPEIQLALRRNPLTGRVFAGDHLDVDVLGNGGEGDLKSTDGRGGRAPSLHISQPGALQPDIDKNVNFSHKKFLASEK